MTGWGISSIGSPHNVAGSEARRARPSCPVEPVSNMRIRTALQQLQINQKRCFLILEVKLGTFTPACSRGQLICSFGSSHLRERSQSRFQKPLALYCTSAFALSVRKPWPNLLVPIAAGGFRHSPVPTHCPKLGDWRRRSMATSKWLPHCNALACLGVRGSWK